MLSDITLGQYYPARSIVHRLDPRTKILATIVIMLATVAAQQLWESGVNLIALIALIRLARLPLGLVFRNLRPFVWLFLLTLGFHCFLTGEGTVIARMPLLGWEITQKGLNSGIIYSVRLAEFVLFAALLTLTTSPIEMTDALDRLLAPLKKIGLPTHEFVLMMTLALRFIPILLEEADRIQKAQMSRGATFEGNLIQRIKSVIPLLIPLFISVFRRADDLALAMDARCYVGGKNRSSYKILKMTRRDLIAALLTVSYMIFFFVN
ncbi:MAG: energy-coupling factor transporter transmembrane protein EcfT [Calditrichaeota bacterium]|nr:energy-coupling factor transporter transmembrane protein EcfT [Calditrichota bacterium]